MMRSILRRGTSWWPWLVAVVASGLPLFAELGGLPIHLWDESRLAVNALEMASGRSNPLVTTFWGAPDFWNTKPPLLIWMQAASLRAFGASEWALRLPSALAGLGTGLLLVGFASRHLKRPWLGTAAACVLFATAGYVTIHGVRTGDYDALLTFFTTAYGLAWAVYIETGRRRTLYITVACIAAAVLTKGVAGLLPAPALLAYALWRGKGRLVFGSVHPYLAAGGLVLVVVGYYVVRERLTPGYFAAVQANELGGRFGRTLEGHRHGVAFYFESLFTKRFIHWVAWWTIGAVMGLSNQDDARLRHATLFSLLFAGTHLLVISAAGTRIEWYDLPALPFMALTAGIGIHAVMRLVRTAAQARGFALNNFLLAGMAGALFIVPYTATKEYSTGLQQHEWDGWDNTNMGFYLRTCLHKGKAPAGIMLWDDYEANLDWYILALRLRGIPANKTNIIGGLKRGTRVMTHRDGMKHQFEAHYLFDTLRTYENIRLYIVRGLRPPDTTRSFRPPYDWWRATGVRSPDSIIALARIPRQPQPAPARLRPAASRLSPR